MKNKLGEFFNELDNNGKLNNNPSLLLLEFPKESHLKLSNLPELNNVHQIFVLATTLVGNGYLEIKVGSHFNIIFPSKDTNSFINCNAILKYVNVNPRYEIDCLPGGYTGICLLEFKEGIPLIMEKLTNYGEKKDYSRHDTLVLTQMEVLDLIKKEI